MGSDKPALESSKGFLKVDRDRQPQVTREQKVALVRRGNELFNSGRLEEAKRIFLTVGYTDGIIRLGDHCLEHGDPLEAFRLYWLAPDRRKVDSLVEKMAAVVRKWLSDDGAGTGVAARAGESSTSVGLGQLSAQERVLRALAKRGKSGDALHPATNGTHR